MATIDRLSGADAISARAKELGAAKGLEVSECVWEIGEDLAHQHAHRLDVSTALKTVRLYFPDLDLTSSGNRARQKRIDDRLNNAIAQLTPRSPVPTYGTSG